MGDKLGLTAYTVKKVVIPLLKRMGLLELEKITTRRYETTVYDLKWVKGTLINRKLEKHHKKKATQYKKKEPLTFEQVQTINKNKEKIAKMGHNLTEEVVVMSKEEFNRLMQCRKENPPERS